MPKHGGIQSRLWRCASVHNVLASKSRSCCPTPRGRFVMHIPAVVVDAVSGEPVSGLNSLVTGRFTGNFAPRERPAPDQTASKCLPIDTFSAFGSCPEQNRAGNFQTGIRELSAGEQGILRPLQGANRLVRAHRPSGSILVSTVARCLGLAPLRSAGSAREGLLIGEIRTRPRARTRLRTLSLSGASADLAPERKRRPPPRLRRDRCSRARGRSRVLSAEPRRLDLPSHAPTLL